MQGKALGWWLGMLSRIVIVEMEAMCWAISELRSGKAHRPETSSPRAIQLVTVLDELFLYFHKP